MSPTARTAAKFLQNCFAQYRKNNEDLTFDLIGLIYTAYSLYECTLVLGGTLVPNAPSPSFNILLPRPFAVYANTRLRKFANPFSYTENTDMVIGYGKLKALQLQNKQEIKVLYKQKNNKKSRKGNKTKKCFSRIFRV